MNEYKQYKQGITEKRDVAHLLDLRMASFIIISCNKLKQELIHFIYTKKKRIN